MKKIILLAAAAVAISLASCGNKSAQQENAEEAAQGAIEAVVEEAQAQADTVVAAADSLINEVKEEVK